MSALTACLFPCLENGASLPETARNACDPHRRHGWRACRRFFSRLIHRGRRNKKDQDQLLNETDHALEPSTQGRSAQRDQQQVLQEELVVDQIDLGMEPSTQRRAQRDQEQMQQNQLVVDQIDLAVKPSTEDERTEINTGKLVDFDEAGLMDMSLFDMITPHFTVSDSEPVTTQHGTSCTSTIHPKVQYFKYFCIFFLLCAYYAHLQREVQIQDLVQNVENSSVLSHHTLPILDIVTHTNSPISVSSIPLDHVSLKLDQVAVDCRWISITPILALLIVGIFVACYLRRDSIGGAIMLTWYILTFFELSVEPRWLRWLRWLNSR